MEENTNEAMLIGLMDQCLEVLHEHLDAVQILGTFVDDDGVTHSVSRGVGNWYARMGCALEFIEMDSAATTAREIGKVLPEQGESGFD